MYKKHSYTVTQQTVLLKRFYTKELYIYGSQRHGTMKADGNLAEATYNLQRGDYRADSLFPAQSLIPPEKFLRTGLSNLGTTDYSQGGFEFYRGYKQYELSNPARTRTVRSGGHLGNVLVTIQDRKWGLQTTTPVNAAKADYYLAYVVTITDYYAFGSAIKERTTSYGSSYRYGFNNQEKETEIGDYYAFEYRIHDARIGRFLSVDPLAMKYAFQSVYVFAGNNPILKIDLFGMGPADPKKPNPQGVVQPNWGIYQFCQAYGISGQTWVHQADKVAQKNLVSFPGYPTNGTIQEKQDYFLSKKYTLFKDQVLNLPSGTKVNQYFCGVPGNKPGTYKGEFWYENGLNAKLGETPIVYNKPLYIPKVSNPSEILVPKKSEVIATVGVEVPVSTPAVTPAKTSELPKWLWWLEVDALTGHADPCLTGDSPVPKPDAGGISLTAGVEGCGLSFSGIQTETDNHYFFSGTYAPPGISLVESPVSFSVDCYYRTKNASPDIPTEEYLKGLSYIYSWGVFTYSYVLNKKGEKVLEGYQYGVTGFGFGISGTKQLNK